MNAKYDSDPDLNEDDIPDASELLDFELIAKSQPDKGQGLGLWAVLVLVLAGGGWAGWMYMQDDALEQASADGVPVITAPKFKLKEKPADPGGMDVPDRDKLVYDRMAGDGKNTTSGVERLLPPPETPLEPPKKVATPTASATVALDMAPPTPKPVPAPVPAPEPIAEPAPVVAPVVAPPAPPTPVVAKPKAAPAPVVPPVVPPAAPKTAFKSTSTAGKGYLVQLSAVRTEQAAKSEWKRVASKNPDVLGGLDAVIQRADLGAKGIFYRVRGGWFATRGEAKAICDELARRNVGCIIAKP